MQNSHKTAFRPFGNHGRHQAQPNSMDFEIDLIACSVLLRQSWWEKETSSRSLLGEERSYSLPNRRRPPAMATVRVTCPRYTPVLGGMLSLLVSCKNAAMREMEQGGFCHLPMPTLLVPQATVPFPPLCTWPFSSPHLNNIRAHTSISLTTPLKYYALYSANP